MRSRAQEQLTSKKSSIDKLNQEIACHKHDLLLLQKQTEDVQKQQESLNEYLKARTLNPKPLSKKALLPSQTHLLPRPTKR
jgi:septal ring factor EnvC (AmiA/AmiB activator)